MLHRVETLPRQGGEEPKQDSDDAGTARPQGLGAPSTRRARLLRIHGRPSASIPASPSRPGRPTDLLDALRTELKLAEKRKEFPKKGTCQAVHSGWINSGTKLEAFLKASYPVSENTSTAAAAVRGLRGTQGQQNVFDFDDLLLYWTSSWPIRRPATPSGGGSTAPGR